MLSLVAAAGVVLLGLVRMLATAEVDYPLTSALNRLAHRWPALDDGMLLFERFNAPKGVALFALAFGAFAATDRSATRWRLVLGCAAASVAAAASRVIQVGLPHLPRPLFDPGLHFTPPYGADLAAMHDWSSYPSDNAALLFGVAFAVWLTDRRMGVVALALFAISALARIYGGLHYTTDIAGGCLLSASLVLAIQAAKVARLERFDGVLLRYRPWFVAAAFFVAAQAASLFDEVRAVAVLMKTWIG